MSIENAAVAVFKAWDFFQDTLRKTDFFLGDPPTCEGIGNCYTIFGGGLTLTVAGLFSTKICQSRNKKGVVMGKAMTLLGGAVVVSSIGCVARSFLGSYKFPDCSLMIANFEAAKAVAS